MDATKILEWLKLGPKYYFAITLASGALLFLGDHFATLLGLAGALTAYRSWIGVAFLVSASLGIAHALTDAMSLLKAKYLAHRNLRSLQRRLKNLSTQEKRILRRFVEGSSRTQKFMMGDGIIGGLEAQKIVYMSSTIGDVFTGFSYNLQPWALEYLQANPQLLRCLDDDAPAA